MTLSTAAGLGLGDAIESSLAPSSELAPETVQQAILDDAFCLACRNGHAEIARSLLDRGAAVDARGFFGGTALHWAAGNGHRAAVDLLLERGASRTAIDDEFNETPSGWADALGHAELAALLEPG